MNLREVTYTQLKADGMLYRQTVDLDPRADAIRVVVRDSATGNLGSLTIPANAVSQ